MASETTATSANPAPIMVGKWQYKEYVGGKRVYVLGEGRLIHFVSAEEHLAPVTDTSFANQARWAWR